MQRKLKSLVRRSISRRKESRPSRADRVSAAIQHYEQSPPLRIRDRDSTGETPNIADSNQLESQHESAQNQLSAPNVSSKADNGQSISDEIDPWVADNYKVYLSAVPPEERTSDAEYRILGGDRRLITESGELRHNEDIANRNIDKYGTSSSRHGSVSVPEGTQSMGPQDVSKERSDTNRVRSTETMSSIPGGSIESFDLVEPKDLGPDRTLGTGTATKDGHSEGIPPVELSNIHENDCKSRPFRSPDGELSSNTESPQVTDDSEGGLHHPRPQSIKQTLAGSHPNEALSRIDGRVMDAHNPSANEKLSNASASLDGVVDLRDSEDVDKTTKWAPAVTHEVVKPHEHHIREEVIFREIHNHEVYHRIQPVYKTEILPARHFIHDANGDLVEVSEDQLPDCTGANQKWSIVANEPEKPSAESRRTRAHDRKPMVLDDKTFMTEEGFERRETTIVHSPELEDLSNYNGLVLPIHFVKRERHSSEQQFKEKKKEREHHTDAQSLTLREFKDNLPGPEIHSYSSSSYHSSVSEWPASLQSSPTFSR